MRCAGSEIGIFFDVVELFRADVQVGVFLEFLDLVRRPDRGRHRAGGRRHRQGAPKAAAAPREERRGQALQVKLTLAFASQVGTDFSAVPQSEQRGTSVAMVFVILQGVVMESVRRCRSETRRRRR